jgi:T5SS/PEP-CTERM-associated repeat protein
MVQTTFIASSGSLLATDLALISTGGADAAINTAYTITMTTGVSLTGSVDLDAGSSLTLEGPFPFNMPGFAVTGTLITDLRFTGTVTLDNSLLINPALDIINGTTVAGLFSGSVLSATGDTSDTAINSGLIISTGSLAAIQFNSGTVQNGWNGAVAASISGVPDGVDMTVSGLVQNDGTIISSGTSSAAVAMGAGTVDNGQIGFTGALLSGAQTGVDIAGAGAVVNDGTILGGTSDAVSLGSGMVTNGQIGVGSALIESVGGNGVSILSAAGSVINNGTISGGGQSGVYLEAGGTITNGASSDPAALIDGASWGVLFAAAGSLLNDGTVQANGNDAVQDVIGAELFAGGTVENQTTAALIAGLEWGVFIEGGAGFVANSGTIQASAGGGLGVDLYAGGTVVNAATTAAIIGGTATEADGVRISAGAPGAGAVVLNDGTIEGTVGVDFQSGSTEAAGTLTNDGLIASSNGPSGDAVIFGTGTERLVLQAGGSFVGLVVGGETSGSSTTLELAAGTQGTLSGLAGNGGTVTDSAGSFVFSNIATIVVDSGASWTVTAPGSLSTLFNAGAVGLAGGALTVTGSLTNSGSLAVGSNTLAATTGVVLDQGVISVGPGGLLQAKGGGITTAGTADIQVGGVDAALDVTGAGATVTTGQDALAIGSTGEGALFVSQGGSVLASTRFAADEAVSVAGTAGATGDVTVTDPGSELIATGQFALGVAGTGSLLIENQATVITGNNTADSTEGFDVGTNSGASGSATISNARLSNTGRFIVGDGGLGSLSIQSGGTVTTSATATIAAQSTAGGSSVSVTGTGSNLQIAGALDIGAAATGQLSVTNGATVTATTLDAGINAAGAGIVTVSGTNADLVTTGTVSVGDSGSGELAILDGASASIAGDLNIANTGTGTGNVDIEDTTGTITFGGNIFVGFNGFGVLNIGSGVTYIQNNGGINFGPDSSGAINSFADPSPYLSNSSPNPIGLGAQGTDPLAAYLFNSGEYTIPNNHTLTFDTPIIYGGGAFSLGSDDHLTLNADTVTAQTFTLGGNDTLTIGTDALQSIDTPDSGTGPFTAQTNAAFGTPGIGGFHGTIANFTVGDTIVVDTDPNAGLSVNGADVEVIENGTTLGTIAFDTAANAQAAFDAGAIQIPHTLCFLPGTLITTPSGERPVERLAVGDRVRTASGADRPVTWIGEGRVLATRGRRSAATPVIVRKGAFAPNVPHTDLHVTKGHAFFVDGLLIPVEFLVNHRSILWDDRAQAVLVYHVELETHDVLLANGAPAESYRDDGNRWLFQNANAGWNQPPKPVCAPVVTGGAAVDAVWRRLLDRCGARPGLPLTDDPDFCLMVDGMRVDASERTDDGVHVFAVPAAAAHMRLVSRSAVPQELGTARDPRCLGVAVRRVAVRQGTRFRVARAGDAMLAEGFHPFEAASGLRWTDGDAVVPADLFAGFTGRVELVVHVGGTTRYVEEGVIARVA